MRKYSDKELTPVEYGRSPVKISEFSFPPHTVCFPFHWHDRMEMLLVDSGELRVSCGGENIIAKKGDLVVVNCGQTHTAHTEDEPVEYRAFMFELSNLSVAAVEQKEYFEPLLCGRMTFEHFIHDRTLVNIFNEMSLEKTNGGDAFPLYLKSYIYLLLGRLCRYYVKIRLIADTDDKDFYEIIEYIEQNFDTDITVRELSDRFGYNEAYFCRKFKKTTGISPAKYIITLRLEKAEKLLLSTESTCEEIAANCGFHDRNYFSRCFSAAFGMTPTACRNLNKKTKHLD